MEMPHRSRSLTMHKNAAIFIMKAYLHVYTLYQIYDTSILPPLYM